MCSLTSAARIGLTAVAELVLAYAEDVRKQLIAHTDVNGRTPLHYAAQEGHVPLVQVCCSSSLNWCD